MLLRLVFIVLVVLSAASGTSAATLTVSISDQHGQSVANAVVTLVPQIGKAPSASSHLAAKQIIDQRDETFIPFVILLPRNGSVVFTNNDHTMHQVYSFSPIRQFEFTLRHGEVSPEVRFAKDGVAAIGCNIHDHMIAYVYVTDNGWSVLSGPDGSATIAALPEGEYDAHLWSPQLPMGEELPATHLSMGKEPTSLALKILLPPARTMRRMRDY